MNHRQRALAAMSGSPADFPAVQYYYTDVGVYEHGEKLNALFRRHPGDFAPVACIRPESLRRARHYADGRYYEQKTDEWGTLWEYRIYGRMGHAIGFPIACDEDYDTYRLPALPRYVTDAAALERLRGEVRRDKSAHVSMRGEGYSYLERLTALRGFEDALCDLHEGGPRLTRFLERLTDHYLQSINKLIELKVDAIVFGDDYGDQRSLLISPELFREALAPHMKRLMDPIREAGIHIHFHSCGKIDGLFSIFEELGVGSIWPQLPLYDMEELAKSCKERHFALLIHTDRAQTMTHGTADDVRALVKREYEVFAPQANGGWFYVEVDNGFPYENVEALVETIYSLRN
jgi:hypothetical protein